MAASMGAGVTLPLGGLALMDASSRSTRQAVRIARKAIEEAQPLARLRGRAFYAVGGTWRALARLHMRQHNYPLDVMHNYRIPADDAAEFASLLERVDSEALADIAVGLGGAAPAARLWRDRARRGDSPGQAQGGRDLRRRRARGPAVRAPVGRGARGRPAAWWPRASWSRRWRARPAMATS